MSGNPEEMREEGKKDSRDAILEAAVCLFGKKGFDGTSVQEVVDAAGVTKGAFYHWFRSKDDVLRLIHDEFIDYELSRAREIVSRGYPASRALALLIEEILVSVERYKANITIFFRDSQKLSEDTFREIKRKRDEFADIVVGIIKRGIEEGEFRSVSSPRILAFGIIGMCGWAYQWFRPGGPLSARQVGALYAEVVLEGLRRS